MSARSIDPYCNYLFQESIGKDLMLSKLDADIEYYYSHNTRFNLEKFKSGEALLKITKSVFSNKKLLKLFSNDEEIAEFHKLNRELVEYNIQKQQFDGEQAYTVIVNFMNSISRCLITTADDQKNSKASVHLDVPGITEQIRKLNGFHNLSLADIKKLQLIKNIVLLIVQVIVICCTLLLGLFLGIQQQKISNDNFLLPMMNSIEKIITDFGSSLGGETVNTVSLTILFITVGLLLSICSIIIGIRLRKNNQFEYEVHYFTRIIGISTEKLREIGWL